MQIPCQRQSGQIRGVIMSQGLPRYMTKYEVAKALHVVVRTIDRWRRQGILPYVKMGAQSNAQVLFEEKDIQDFMDRRKHNTFLRGHGDGWQYNSGFLPGQDKVVVTGSKAEREVVDNTEEFEHTDDRDYSDAPPLIY